MSPLVFSLATLACGVGALLRFLLTKINREWKFPWPTFAANVLGSILLGAIAHAAITSPHPDALMLIVGGGFAGGLTTFSSLAVDAVVLSRAGRPGVATGYLGATCAAGLLGAALGWALAGAF